MAPIPPTTPPTIAPIGGLLAAASVVDVELEELVGRITNVVVTICPDELVVTYCDEIVEETSLVTVDSAVVGAIVLLGVV